MKSAILSVLCLGAACAATASEPLTLTFQRSGTDAGSVVVTSSLSGVTASLTSVSHSLKAFGSETLCADANGNSNPTIVYTFSLAGLPADWSFNQVGLDITGYNSSGKHQLSTDKVKRQFNVSVAANGSIIASYTDLDPAAGIEDARKVWETNTTAIVKPTSPATLTITVTKGTENNGCFFGLNSIILSTVGGVDPNPGPDPAPSNKIYNIKWKNNTQSYITAMADGSIQIGNYNIKNPVFWEFIPTDKENCYYIRNTANGLYIGSCNKAPSSNSRVSLSTVPVEYYVHLSAATSGDNKGCYWMSSTDCDNYSDETKSPRALNKDGASNYIITWTAAVGNIGSYWTLVETTDLYEICPFTIGTPYNIADEAGNMYDHSGNWTEYNPSAKNTRWIFDGTSNAEGGYKIVNAQTNQPINDGARYRVVADGNHYGFITADSVRLQLGGKGTFGFIRARNDFALNNRIYQMPCGQISDTWISSVSHGEFHYPMATAADEKLTAGTINSAPRKYEILTRDAITATPGSEIALDINLNKVPTEAYSLIVFADFDRDGIFEYSTEPACSQNIVATVKVPEATKLGDIRMRLRLTANGLKGADDDVLGEILDLKLNIIEPGTALLNPIVKPNDASRGTAEWANNIAMARSKGNALFLYWSEGMRVVGATNRLEVEPANNQRTLIAVFSANTDDLDGIDPVLLNTANTNAEITYNGSEIAVKGAEAISLLLFNLNGQVVAATESSVLSAAGLASGVYIAKAITSEGVVSSKIIKQ